MVSIRMPGPLLDGSAVHTDSGYSGRREFLTKLDGIVDVGQHANLASDGYADGRDHGREDGARFVGTRQKGRSHPALEREVFRTTHVDVDAGHVPFANGDNQTVKRTPRAYRVGGFGILTRLVPPRPRVPDGWCRFAGRRAVFRAGTCETLRSRRSCR